MDTLDKYQRKRILKDPLAALQALNANTDPATIGKLETLHKRYVELSGKYGEHERRKGILSRNIGDAKKKGHPLNDLKEAMREESKHYSSVRGALSEVRNQILDYFQTNPANSQLKEEVNAENLEERWTSPEQATGNIKISILNTGEHGEWNSYIESNPAASVYHRAEWCSLIRQSFGHESYYFLARNNNRHIVGILPLVRLKSRLFGDFLVSMPFFNYGGAVGDTPDIEQQLIDTANTTALEIGASHVEYRDDIARHGLHVRNDKVNMILGLPDTAGALWSGFGSKLRAQINRPQREHPVITIAGEKLVADFYQVFSRNMRDLGTPVYSKQFFANIMAQFPERSRIIVVSLSGNPVASGFLISHGRKLEIPWASTISGANHLSVNMLLYWEALKYAVEKGHSHFDFGRSSRNSGTYRFKQQWGAMPKQSYWHYWLNQRDEMPAINPGNPKYRLAINLWKRLPLAIANRLGPRIVKNIP